MGIPRNSKSNERMVISSALKIEKELKDHVGGHRMLRQGWLRMRPSTMR